MNKKTLRKSDAFIVNFIASRTKSRGQNSKLAASSTHIKSFDEKSD
jgi:hypothetical protein